LLSCIGAKACPGPHPGQIGAVHNFIRPIITEPENAAL
jgi:hypothetical protein